MACSRPRLSFAVTFGPPRTRITSWGDPASATHGEAMKLFCKISMSVTPTTNDRGIAALVVTPNGETRESPLDACFSRGDLVHHTRSKTRERPLIRNGPIGFRRIEDF